MKYLKNLFLALCIAGALSIAAPTGRAESTSLVGYRKAFDKRLYHQVEIALGQRISGLEKSLKENIPQVDEVFDGSTIMGEIGVGVKVYKNNNKDGYYYFLMATIDKLTKDDNPPSKSRYVFVNDLSFASGQTEFISKLKEDLTLAGSDGRSKGTTFILDSSVKKFYVGVRYHDGTENKEGYLFYVLEFDGQTFQGYGNGELCFEKKLYDDSSSNKKIQDTSTKYEPF